MDKYDVLKIENQLCFPLYACSKEIVRKYKPMLDKLDLTYTQYIVMLVLWEYGSMNVSELGNKIMLDSGTLTPVLKKIEKKGYVERNRLDTDERNLVIKLTEEGKKLKEQAVKVPLEMGKCIDLTEEEAKLLYKILYKIINKIGKEE